MLKVNSSDLFNYLKEQSSMAQVLSNKELVLATFASQHLQGYYDFHIGAGSAAAGVGVALSFFALNPVFSAVVTATGIVGAVSTLYNAVKDHQLKKMLNIFTEELTSRYPSMLEAYIEIKAMIQSIEREELVDYFNKANNN